METTFQDLGLSEGLLQALNDAGYSAPTAIQEKAIPAVLMMRDVMGVAQTGTGKTAGFTLPMIDVLAEGQGRAKMPRSLILSPTRELAAQIAENFEKYGKNHALKMALLIGGESMKEQGEILDKGVDVLIATPGRMLDQFERGAIILNDVKILVIDEADRMLDMGFIPDIETIVSKLPGNRQTLMFSATMPKEIKKLADKFLDNPKLIEVARQSSTASTVTHSVLMCGPKQKREELRNLLENDPPESAIVFCNRKRDIGVLVRSLKRHGYDAGELHGDLAQPVRMDTLDKFKSGEIKILVCSDVAARGIDVASVSHVFNFDVPNHPEDYVHRIGRTGRAGRSGRAVMFATDDDAKALAAIEGIIGKKIDVVEGISGGTSTGGGRSASGAAKKADRASAAADSGDKGSERGGRGRGRRDRGSKDNGGEISVPQKVNMADWTEYAEEDVTRAAEVFEGIIPAFLLRKKNAPTLTPLEELDEAAAQEAEELEAEKAEKAEKGPAEGKPKRKRGPRKKKTTKAADKDQSGQDAQAADESAPTAPETPQDAAVDAQAKADNDAAVSEDTSPPEGASETQGAAQADQAAVEAEASTATTAEADKAADAGAETPDAPAEPAANQEPTGGIEIVDLGDTEPDSQATDDK